MSILQDLTSENAKFEPNKDPVGAKVLWILISGLLALGLYAYVINQIRVPPTAEKEAGAVNRLPPLEISPAQNIHGDNHINQESAKEAASVVSTVFATESTNFPGNSQPQQEGGTEAARPPSTLPPATKATTATQVKSSKQDKKRKEKKPAYPNNSNTRDINIINAIM